MYEKELKELIKISQFAGKRVDYTQGGGGNTSVKLDEKLMAIKASGYKLSEITEHDAFVTVDYKMVQNYYNNVNKDDKKDFEAESSTLAKDSIRLLPDMKPLRPSVEVGFHAILKKYVIHIHSAYAGIIVCSKTGEQIISQLLSGKDYGFVFVPYINPGFTLTLVMAEKIKEYYKKYNKIPEAIFMINHGIVVHSDTSERAMKIISEINDAIMNYFKISPKEFSEINLRKINDTKYMSVTPVVIKYLKNNPLNQDILASMPLYPDQLVYLNNCIALTPDKMEVIGGSVIYNTNLKEATTLEETLAAYLFVISKIKENNLLMSIMGKKDVEFINNWEAEKFRRSIAK